MFVHKAKDVYKYCVILEICFKNEINLDSMEFFGILIEYFSFVIEVKLFISEYLVLILSSEETCSLCSTNICTQI